VEKDFLSRLNVICQEGHQAIQCHRTAKNADNDIAMLDGISEEINNSIFRRAHNNIGLSSALIGSGMCFDYEWFRNNVNELDTAVEDRELEALLTRQGVYVKYVDDLYVMDEKVSTQDNFQRQRLRWMTGQIQALLQMAPYLPKAFATGNVNYIDKTIQQMLIPRSILLVFLACWSLLITLLAPVWSVKWWMLLGCFCVALFIAIPSRLRTRAVFGRLVILPRLVARMIANIVHIDRNNREFIHTTHDK
jgi:cellulose synthase/poly-beta-1,6-N-acetylglucosamine synthase-like glycosyltransferase